MGNPIRRQIELIEGWGEPKDKLWEQIYNQVGEQVVHRVRMQLRFILIGHLENQVRTLRG